MRAVLAAAGCLLLVACAATVPDRYVVERDLGAWSYRRYQRTLDVEFPIEGNAAVGHTAVYIERTEGDAPLRTAAAFVTVYERAEALTAEVSEQLATLGTYDRSVDKVSGHWVWRLDGGGDTWLLWVSGAYLVKVGIQDGDVPDALARRYLAVYRSDLDAHGRARPGRPSAGKSRREREEAGEETMPIPRHLQRRGDR
jgi:hypothetical protein